MTSPAASHMDNAPGSRFVWGDAGPPDKELKLTKPAAPGRMKAPPRAPAARTDGRTGSQLVPGVRRTWRIRRQGSRGTRIISRGDRSRRAARVVSHAPHCCVALRPRTAQRHVWSDNPVGCSGPSRRTDLASCHPASCSRRGSGVHSAVSGLDADGRHLDFRDHQAEEMVVGCGVDALGDRGGVARRHRAGQQSGVGELRLLDTATCRGATRPEVAGPSAPPNKGFKLTNPGWGGASQLVPGVRPTSRGAPVIT
jgi:hypothetical protein